MLIQTFCICIMSQSLVFQISKEEALENANIKLAHPAAENTLLMISSISGTVSKSYSVKAGENEITLFVSQLPSGIYNLSLIENGKTIDTKKITKR